MLTVGVSQMRCVAAVVRRASHALDRFTSETEVGIGESARALTASHVTFASLIDVTRLRGPSSLLDNVNNSAAVTTNGNSVGQTRLDARRRRRRRHRSRWPQFGWATALIDERDDRVVSWNNYRKCHRRWAALSAADQTHHFATCPMSCVEYISHYLCALFRNECFHRVLTTRICTPKWPITGTIRNLRRCTNDLDGVRMYIFDRFPSQILGWLC